MKQITCSMMGMLLLLVISLQTIAGNKTMPWTTKSPAAKQLAWSGANHMMNAEFERAYSDLAAAVKLDPEFSAALALLSNLSRGQARKDFAARAIKSAANKSAGEKLFVSLVDDKMSPQENTDTWAKLYSMYPDDKLIGNFFVQTRNTADERFTAAQDYIKRFPAEPAMYNTLGYLYMQDKKDNAMAKTSFEKYIAMYPDGSNPYDSMGEYYLDMGDTENANKYYSMSLEKYPFTTSSINALQKMADAKKAAVQKN